MAPNGAEWCGAEWCGAEWSRMEPSGAAAGRFDSDAGARAAVGP